MKWMKIRELKLVESQYIVSIIHDQGRNHSINQPGLVLIPLKA